MMGLTTFHKASRSYEKYATPQRWAADQLMIHCESITTPPDSILELGCGTGILTRQLSNRFPGSRITAIDAAPGMIHIARQYPTLENVLWIQDDISACALPDQADLIISNATLHWLDDLPSFLSKLRTNAGENTQLLFSVMLDGTVNEVREARRRAVPHHPEPFPLPSLSEIITACERAGWIVQHAEDQSFGSHFSSAWALLQSLQRTGVNGGKFGSGKMPLSPAELKRVAHELTCRFETEQGIPLHYQVGFLSCGTS